MIMDLRMIIKQLSEFVYRTSLDDSQRIQYICEFLSAKVNAKIVLIYHNGEIIFSNSSALIEGSTDTYFNESLKAITQAKENITATELQLKKYTSKLNSNEQYTLYPLLIDNERKSILLLHKGDTFTESELTILEFSAILLSLLCSQIQDKKNEEVSRHLSTVKSAVGALSYTELEAVLLVFKELQGKNGLVVVSKLADKNNITRSIIVNAVRKLESGGLVETRSLGMKGTYIKIISETLVDELSKLTH